MTTNPFFEEYEQDSEQDLLNDLVIESYQQFGQDMKYIPRHLVNYSKLFGADDSSRYDDTYTLEMFIKNVLGFGGDKEFYSAFGHQVRDEVVFSVSKDRFFEEVGRFTGQVTPDEGDLIFFPMNRKCFTIKFVDPREMFYQLGKVYTWELTCEVFEYSGETINTGDSEIDVVTELSTNIVDWAILSDDGKLLTDDDGAILVVDDFSLESIQPTYENEFLPPEVTNTTTFDVRTVDPFDFLKSQTSS